MIPLPTEEELVSGLCDAMCELIDLQALYDEKEKEIDDISSILSSYREGV